MNFSPRVAWPAAVTAVILAALSVPANLLAQQSAEKPNPQHLGIVFVGSSIFAFWTHLTEQMAPLPVLNRAFPGAVTQDMLARVDQLVFRYQPRIVVYYCGSNDISEGDSAEPIVARTKQFVKIVGEKSPNTFVYYTSILKAPEKRDRWDVVDAVNREMERESKRAKNLGYIDLNPVLFDAQGKLREELFLPDQLHFRPDRTAYPEFAQIVKPILNKAWESGVGAPKKN